VQVLCLENPRYGSRRLAHLLKRAGEHVNRKRVQRIMREDNLLCLRAKKFVVTTDSNHAWEFYPNLARDLTLTNVNQLWVADITYIRLREEFAYLAVVLDAYSRRIIGWALESHIRSELVLTAMTYALRDRPVPSGLIHHSDRGVQYCCGDYIHLLRQYDIRPSMSRKRLPAADYPQVSETYRRSTHCQRQLGTPNSASSRTVARHIVRQNEHNQLWHLKIYKLRSSVFALKTNP